MQKRYVVAPGQMFMYPADSISAKTVELAGGLSKMTPEERLKIKYKTVKEGDDCSDLSSFALEVWLARGWVIEVESKPVSKPKTEPKIEPTVEKEEVTNE